MATPGSALVFGAGQCDDIPLDRLADRFERVRLLDEDRTALDEGVDRANLEPAKRARIELGIGDLTGVTAELSTVIREELQRRPLPAAEHVESWIDALAGAVDRGVPTSQSNLGAPDFIVVSCVLSQLHVTAVHRVLDEIGEQTKSAGRPELVTAVRQSPRWTEALLSLARRMEDRFIDDLALLLSSGGIAYVSDTVQMCFVRPLPNGDWTSDGLYRMTRTPQLADYFDRRFRIEPLGEWAWVVAPPANPEDVGRVYRVQGLRVRRMTE
jgi:hypothetical protein